MTQPQYQTIWDTLALSETVATVGLGETIVATDAVDERDTLRSSLPRLPLGDETDAHFRVDSLLGRGGMGVVHLAHQKALGRDVAIKTIPQDVVSRAAENSLLQEARVMGLVEHPNVVPVHIIGQDDVGRPVIVMKRVEGTTWDEFLEGQVPVDSDDPLGFHIGICVAVCRAISLAHARDVVHRDIKPANVMVGEFGEVYVLDWGLAVSMDESNTRIPVAAAANAISGTPAYMAPEMTIGDGSSLGPYTDIFLIGAVLYHAVTGEPPNRGETLFEVMRFSYEGRTREYGDAVAPELAAICEKAMHIDPRQRYASADELREHLEEFLGHRNSIDLGVAATARLGELEQSLEDPDVDDDIVYALFGETRFGFSSALQIWPENTHASEGLQRCLTRLIEHEIGEANVKAARVLLLELPETDAALAQRIDDLAGRLTERAEELEQIEFDYDENVGIGVKRRVVTAMALVFAIAAMIPLIFGAPSREFGTLFALLIAPVLVGNLVYTQRHLSHHRISRIFAKGLLLMWVFGFSARSAWYWGGIPFHVGVAAEAWIFSAALFMLGLAIDRRLGGAAVPFGIAAPLILLFPERSHELFSASAFLASATFLFYDDVKGRHLRRR